MSKRAFLALFLETEKEADADVVVKAAQQSADFEVTSQELYLPHKGGTKISGWLQSSTEDWSVRVLETIEIAQNLGRNWIITGDIQNELSLWSNDPKINGILSVNIELVKNGQV